MSSSKVLNRATNRWVSMYGAIGKAILAEAKACGESPSSSEPSKKKKPAKKKPTLKEEYPAGVVTMRKRPKGEHFYILLRQEEVGYAYKGKGNGTKVISQKKVQQLFGSIEHFAELLNDSLERDTGDVHHLKTAAHVGKEAKKEAKNVEGLSLVNADEILQKLKSVGANNYDYVNVVPSSKLTFYGGRDH